MNYELHDKSKSEEAIPTEDMALIRAMVTLPKESKILARGIILGLDIADRAELPSNPGA